MIVRQNSTHIILTIAAALLITAGATAAEAPPAAGDEQANKTVRRVLLKDGQVIEGRILKENDEAVFVDLSFSVLRLPRAEIDRLEDQPSADAQASTAAPALAADALPYQRVAAPSRSLGRQQLVDLVKQAVVIVSNAKGSGSGFFIDNQGHIITNYHVTRGSKYQKVTILRSQNGEVQRKRISEVETKAYSPLLDIALLQVKAEDLEGLDIKPLPIYDGPGLNEGEPVYAVGNPGVGMRILDHSITKGIISSPDRNFGDVLYVQTTAQINPGNSGGPLVNTRGEVIGLVTLKASFQEGIAFALPPHYLHHFLRHERSFAYGKNNPNSGYRYLKPSSDE
ncbi:S1C family serine protease [Candidatus Sumerlaeota bacterium]